MKIHDVEQGTDAWFKARMGIPTASEFSTVLAKGEGKTRRTYMHKLAGERITGELMDSYTNADMERGKAMEDEARNFYGLMTGAEPVRVGFVTRDAGDAGCSPDSSIGKKGLLEIKTAKPHILINYLLKGDFPPEHVAQCQGALWVCEREWIDIAIYWPKMPLFRLRATRNEAYIAELAREVARFNDELNDVVHQIKKRM
jgi:hypothetical protein